MGKMKCIKCNAEIEQEAQFVRIVEQRSYIQDVVLSVESHLMKTPISALIVEQNKIV